MSEIITTFRALSGSQHVYYTSEDPVPAGVTDIVSVSERLTDATVVDTVISQSGGGSDVLWAWNGEDVSQFDTNWAKLRNFTSGSISIEPDPAAPLGNWLVVSGVGTSGQIVFLANQELDTTNYYIEFGIDTVTAHGGAGAGGQYCGVAFWASGSGTDYHGIAWVHGNSTAAWQHRFDGSAGIVLPGSTPGTTGLPNKIVLEVVGNKVSGSDPKYLAWAKTLGNAVDCNSLTELDLAGPYGGDWASLVPTRFGVVAQTSGGWSHPVIRFSYIIVRRHPIDKPVQSA
jgi:hypothetical protein